MRAMPALALAGLLVVFGTAWASPAHAVKTSAAAVAEAPPLTRLPTWAVPLSYWLVLKSDPEATGYTGKVTIAVDLKKASDHLWLHGKDLRVSKVTVTDSHGRVHVGRYNGAVDKAAADAGVARVDFGATLAPQRLQITFDYSAPFNQTLQGYYKVTFAGNAYLQTQMEAISARLAFPCFDEPGFKAPLTLTLTIPQADKAVANTAEAPSLKPLPAPSGWKTITF